MTLGGQVSVAVLLRSRVNRVSRAYRGTHSLALCRFGVMLFIYEK